MYEPEDKKSPSKIEITHSNSDITDLISTKMHNSEIEYPDPLDQDSRQEPEDFDYGTICGVVKLEGDCYAVGLTAFFGKEILEKGYEPLQTKPVETSYEIEYDQERVWATYDLLELEQEEEEKPYTTITELVPDLGDAITLLIPEIEYLIDLISNEEIETEEETN